MKTRKIILLFMLPSLLFATNNAHRHKSFYSDIDKFVKLRVDSLNIITKSPQVIPQFIFDKNLDLQITYWSSLHEPNSLRYLILRKINNLEILYFLRDDVSDKRMKEKPIIDSPLPFRDYSFYDLVVYRINEVLAQQYYKNFKRKNMW